MYKQKCFIGSLMAAVALLAGGCTSGVTALTRSASGKNLDINGYLMMGRIESANAETATPRGEFFMGRVNYKSRRVAINADQKVPTTGNFRATCTSSIFGTREMLIEYDFTAANSQDTALALEKFNQQCQTAQSVLIAE